MCLLSGWRIEEQNFDLDCVFNKWVQYQSPEDGSCLLSTLVMPPPKNQSFLKMWVGLVEDAQTFDMVSELLVSLCDDVVIQGFDEICDPSARFAAVVHDVSRFLVAASCQWAHSLHSSVSFEEMKFYRNQVSLLMAKPPEPNPQSSIFGGTSIA